MRKYIFLLPLIFGLGSLTAQTFLPEVRLTPKSIVQTSKVAAQDTINILAVMVEFQPDDYNLTFGDGTFGSIYTQDYGTSIIDPLPHDANYFRSHLEFAKRYFSKVSNGKVTVNYNVLPQVLTVSQTMRNYSPDKKTNDYSPLADFAAEVWELADNNFSNVDFGNYDLFIIFHAGVGGEVLLPGSLGNEKDLPSLFFNEFSLKSIYGPDFDGFPVNNGNFKITNTVILPETESRETSSFGESYLFELSINGLIVSNIASFMGLPDLFNTETGHSAIGRFGLMDGQSIFAYGGLFPPEPSAWEKVFLGWETPVEIKPTEGKIMQTIVNRFTASFSDTTLIKIPINATEYYLIENRMRDANSNGCVITYRKGSDTLTVVFSEDNPQGFNNDNVSLLEGVILDVDEYDWALPGNGIVIWHIDEKVIEEKISVNKINVDKLRRGVDVEEADGIQDIGELFTNFLGETSEGRGTEYDFWYADNPSELYENEFGPNSKPNTNSNSGANSLITINEFSKISTRMSFNLSFADNNLSLIDNRKLDLGENGKEIFFTGGKYFIIDSNELKIFNSNNTSYTTIDSFCINRPAFIENEAGKYVIGFFGNKVNVLSVTDTVLYTNDIPKNVVSYPAAVFLGEDIIIYGGVAGGVVKIGYNTIDKTFKPVEVIDFPTPNNISHIAVNNDYVAGATGNELFDSGNNKVEFGNKILQILITPNSSGNYSTVVLTEGNEFNIVENGVVTNQFVAGANDEIINFSVADLYGDGNNYILFTAGNRVYAYNFQGAFAQNFPYGIPNESTKGIPLVVDFNNDEKVEILSFTDENIIGFSPLMRKKVEPFPLSVGGSVAAWNFGNVSSNSFEFVLLLKDNTVLRWKGGFPFRGLYIAPFADNANTGFIRKPSQANSEKDFFPEERTYNWPNPVYGNETYIRTYVNENSDVTVRIFDLGGDLVKILEFKAVAGADNEVVWDVSNVQSGAYFASVEVKSVSGKTANKIIKIAVVK